MWRPFAVTADLAPDSIGERHSTPYGVGALSRRAITNIPILRAKPSNPCRASHAQHVLFNRARPTLIVI
jgi:hypothetical protein